MKLIINLFLILLLIFTSLSTSVFSVGWDSEPGVILSELKDDTVQKTAVDEAGVKGGITDSMKNLNLEKMVPRYIQWMAYIGLGLALLAIIYNGIVLLTNFGDKSKVGVVKKRLISITIGVVLVVSSYLVLELVVSLIGNLTP